MFLRQWRHTVLIVLLIYEMQDVLFILENEEKRKDFILRLKHAGETSPEFQAIRDVMFSLHVNKPPREVNQATI